MAKEIDFGTMPTVKTNIKWVFKNILRHDKVGLFITINILLYWVVALLAVFRLFGLL